MVRPITTDIVQPVSNKCFQTMNEAKLFTLIQKKSRFAMQLMPDLKDSFMTNHCTQEIAIAPIGDALIIGNKLAILF